MTPWFEGLHKCIDQFTGDYDQARGLIHAAPRIFFVGNGGSAAIASHQAIDYTKNGGKKAVALNDPMALTCLANDYGYEHVFSKQLEHQASPWSLLIAISSSGKSQNILNAVTTAKEIGCKIITLSGFDPKNPLRRMGDVNFHIASEDYGHVEIVHLSILHSMVNA